MRAGGVREVSQLLRLMCRKQGRKTNKDGATEAENTQNRSRESWDGIKINEERENMRFTDQEVFKGDVDDDCNKDRKGIKQEVKQRSSSLLCFYIFASFPFVVSPEI